MNEYSEKRYQSDVPYARAILIISALAAGGLSLTAWRICREYPRSDAVVIDADLINLASDVSGRIITLNVKTNQSIKKGEILYQIDPEPYRYQVEEAEATVAVARAELDQRQKNVNSEQTGATVAQQQVDRARTNLALAGANLARIIPLGPKGYVTAQSIDEARTKKNDADISFAQAQQQAASAQRNLGNIDAAKAAYALAIARLNLARRALRETTVRAPCDGIVSGLTASAGQYVVAGVPLFTVINTEAWYAVANLRETDLLKVQPGTHAKIWIMTNRRRMLRGVVESIGSGIQDDENVHVQGHLPHVENNLDWVRVAHRFPVRIRITDIDSSLLRVGASAVVVIESN